MTYRPNQPIPPSEITPEASFRDRRRVLAALGGAAAVALGGLGTPARGPVGCGAGRTREAPAAEVRAQRALVGQGRGDVVRRRHQLQQLLRVRHRQDGPEGQCRHAAPTAVERRGRRRGGGHRPFHARGHPQAARARGARLPVPLRRSLVDGRAVDGFSGRRPAEALPADLEGPLRRVHHPARPEADARASVRWCSTGPTPRDCGWTRRCIRSRCWWSASTASGCPTRTARRCGLIVPWKYGFKSIKSIVKIRFAEREPRTSWNLSAPYEYGFYANVNPAVDHPRWSQAKERRIGTGFLRRAHRHPAVQRLRGRRRRPLQGHGPAALLLSMPCLAGALA